MTNKTETQEKKTPCFYIFSKDDNENSQLIGAIFSHAKGKGLNILIGEKRLVAFPPKQKNTAGREA